MVSHVPFWKRLAWMAVIWAASVVALGIVTGAMRVWLSG
ncbi:DUF2474 family protein [Mesorhizobium atlanticum]|jgi:hypothetical protein|uniref:DUF2474 domain-containing protein n=1 Tax=Mesorhizobium atlanticum TaxID=2233532 RepID=A0A330GUT1_9HYPH|nr:DUF2474 family protein [Mesorhizobium atlanticum]RAZ77009.1 DUF2474 domain-containing protein [Mesorhizobium atlanticum]